MNAVVARKDESIEPQNMLAVISRAASDPAVDVEKMERLMALYERNEARNAETDFNIAMNAAQQRMSRIGADATNPQTRSKYATYGKLDSVLRPIYTSEGFALSFGTGEPIAPETIRVICHVSHRAGHTRMYHADVPVDGKGAKGNDVMTKTHALGSGASYGMRYLLKMIFNVAIGEEDDDGNAADAQPDIVNPLLDMIEVAQSISELQTVKPLITAAELSPANKQSCIGAYNVKLKTFKATK